MDWMATQAEYADFDFADFAQEFLRRNQVYRREHAAIAQLAGQDPSAPSFREMARAWGLAFPHRAARQRDKRACRLECCGGALGRPYEPCAKRIRGDSP